MNENSIDFIGDVHGHFEELKMLLKKLGYVESAGAFRHECRRVVFLGDYVDRGPNVRATLNLVRAMVEADSAIALLGNHEFNMLSFWQKNEANGRSLKKMKDGFLREHSFNKVAMHSKTVADYSGRKSEFFEMLDFVKSMPLFLETKTFRAEHAAFDFDSAAILNRERIRCLNDGNFDELILRANDENHEFENSLFEPISNFVKGPEMELPGGASFIDGEGVCRKKARVNWWENPHEASFLELCFQPGSELNFSGAIPFGVKQRKFYGEKERPVFFGHYWLTGLPKLIRQNICCLDYSVASFRGNGLLVAYRFDGEQILDSKKFVWVNAL